MAGATLDQKQEVKIMIRESRFTSLAGVKASRPGQLRLANLVLDGITSNRRPNATAFEAGTGSGKTFIAAVPVAKYQCVPTPVLPVSMVQNRRDSVAHQYAPTRRLARPRHVVVRLRVDRTSRPCPPPATSGPRSSGSRTGT